MSSERERFSPAGQRVLPGAAPSQLALDGSEVVPPLSDLLKVAAAAKPTPPREQLRLDVEDPPELAPLLATMGAAKPPEPRPARTFAPTAEQRREKTKRKRRKPFVVEQSWAERRDAVRASKRAERERRHTDATRSRVIATLKGVGNGTAYRAHCAVVESPAELGRLMLKSACGEAVDPDTGETGPRLSLGSNPARRTIALVRALYIASRRVRGGGGWRVTTTYGIDWLAETLPPGPRGTPVHRNTLAGTLHRGEADGREWAEGRCGDLKRAEQVGCFQMRQPMDADGYAPSSLPPDEVGPSGRAFVQFWWPPWVCGEPPSNWSEWRQTDPASFDAGRAAARGDSELGARAPPDAATTE